MVREQLRELFDTHNKYLVPKRVQTNGLLSANISDIIYQRFNVLKKVRLPWVSMETDGWTSNKGTDCISVTINLVTGNMDKACFPIYFSEVETKEKQELTETLLSLIKKFSLSKLLTSCCTDNAASVIGATDSLKGDEQFPFFNSHNGCAVHQIQLFVRALIDDIIENLQTDTENTGLENDEEDLELFPNICSVDIVQRLMALTKKLRKCFTFKRSFKDCVETLPPSYCNTRWNSIFYLLEHFLKNVEGYEKFKASTSHGDNSFSTFVKPTFQLLKSPIKV